MRLLVALVICLFTATAWPSVAVADNRPQCTGNLGDLTHLIFEPLGSVDPAKLCGQSVSSLDFGEAGTAVSLRISENDIPDIGQNSFHGLATFYSKAKVYLVRESEILKPFDDEGAMVDEETWVALAGRYDVLMIRFHNANVTFGEQDMNVSWAVGDNLSVEALIADKGSLSAIDPAWRNMRYIHLWDWLAGLTRIIEWGLLTINRLIGGHWGLSILIFAVAIKIILLPVSLLVVRLQRQVSKLQAALAPQLAEIKLNYKGQEAHERVMAAHKSLGITPFYTLKSMIVPVVQVPLLVAIFTALGEMPNFVSIPFLWIDDMSLPDTVARLSVSIPMLGDRVSLMPIVMTGTTVFSTIIYQDPHAPEIEVRRQKRNLYLMAIGFFILFYPFPAAMVYFWVLANILQTLQQQIVRL